MPTIYDYTDYRDAIRDFYLDKKKSNSKYSYSVLGMAIGLNASHVFCVVEKKRNLPVRCVPAMKKLLGLTGRAAQYFDHLLAASRTKSEKTRQEILAKASLLRDVNRPQGNRRDPRTQHRCRKRTGKHRPPEGTWVYPASRQRPREACRRPYQHFGRGTCPGNPAIPGKRHANRCPFAQRHPSKG